MPSEVEKLRALLARARGVISEEYDREIPSVADCINAALAELVEPVECEFSFCNRMNTRKRDSDGRWYCVEHIDAALAEPAAPVCADCGHTLTEVRPGKHQCDACDSARVIDALKQERDDALARCETLRDLADKTAWAQGDAQRRMIEAQKQRDEARAELALLRERTEVLAGALRAACLPGCSHEGLDCDDVYTLERQGAYAAGLSALGDK
jgi:hypothetical protein